jgi:predicted acetyltransferase
LSGKLKKERHFFAQMLMCSELIYTDMDAYRSLWTFLATKHDLVGNITIAKVPRDDPAPLVLLEPRLLRTTGEVEGSWCAATARH